jgi:hypothetical protein
VQNDRRIGQRVNIVPVAATWTPVTVTKWYRRRPRPQAVRVVEISVTGARLVSASRDAVAVGMLMTLDVAGSHSIVEVRHITATDSGYAFGVMFVTLAPALEKNVYDTIARFSTQRARDGDP